MLGIRDKNRISFSPRSPDLTYSEFDETCCDVGTSLPRVCVRLEFDRVFFISRIKYFSIR